MLGVVIGLNWQPGSDKGLEHVWTKHFVHGEPINTTALALARSFTPRAAVALIGALHLIVFAGPILLSTDVFSYIAYARMGVEHGLNPYLHGPSAISADPVFHYVGQDWKHVATAYGPLYTLVSYPLAPLGLRGALWGMKIVALLASAVTLVLTWRCARVRGLDPVFAILAVGANPLYVVYTVGGAHNDLIMLALMMAAVVLTLARRDAAAAAAVVAGALVKVTVAALLPFASPHAQHEPKKRIAGTMLSPSPFSAA